MVSYYFDTYALIEIIKRNPNYSKYSKDVGIVLTRLNLMELYYYLLRSNKRFEGLEAFKKLLEYAIPYQNNTIQKACEFRHKYKKYKLSYVDCLGYVIAQERKIKFLTSDIGFKNLDNVEFVK